MSSIQCTSYQKGPGGSDWCSIFSEEKENGSGRLGQTFLKTSLCVKPGSLWLVTCFILVTSCIKKTSYLFCELYFVFVFCLNLFVVFFNLGIWNLDNWIKSVFNSTEHSIINNKFTTVVNLLCIIINYAQYLNTGCLHGNLFSRKLVSDLNIWS